jgi:ketosteroid isomerase-like protein
MPADRKEIVRDSYAAFAAGDRSFFEQRLSDGFQFSAPPTRSSTVTATLSGAGQARGGASTSISSG